MGPKSKAFCNTVILNYNSIGKSSFFVPIYKKKTEGKQRELPSRKNQAGLGPRSGPAWEGKSADLLPADVFAVNVDVVEHRHAGTRGMIHYQSNGLDGHSWLHCRRYLTGI